MITKRLLILLFSVIFTVLLSACRRDKDDEQTFDDTIYNQESTASYVDKALEEEEDGLTLKNLNGTGNCVFQYTNSCATITESSLTFPKTITVDYGTGCLDWHGRTRSGKIFIHLTDTFLNENAVRTVTFEDFFINNVGISGSRTTTNAGLNNVGQPIFTRVIDTDITTPNGTFQRNFTHQMTWLEGYDTPACFDNVWSITGAGTVIRPNGVSIARNIVSPLIVDFSCPYIKQGVIEMYSIQGTWVLNFGDGVCDNNASITRPNGVVLNITL